MNNLVKMRKEGIGSYFHFENDQELLKDSTIDLNFNYKICYTGRHALLHILNEVTSSKQVSKIWFPNYYCQHTLHWIKKFHPVIHTYDVNPFEFPAEINISNFADSNDVVLINNYWGLSTMPKKSTATGAPLVIEDHSHGWLSKACLNSEADYCFVSLRKSLPIPLGGMYWQPNSSTNDIIHSKKNNNDLYEAWDLMVQAMKLKSKYVDGDETIETSTYLPLFYDVEEALNINSDFAELLDDHEDFIRSFINLDTKQLKNNNLDVLYSEIQDTPYFKVVKRPDHTAFGLLLLFKDEKEFNSLKSFLVSNGVYPSSLWPDNKIDYEWRYFLNLHIDFRYTTEDMEYIIETINKWLNNI
ncbi:hypothetical protein [Flavivirga eckloniae]|uniref:DegT/DnrJ/EryC1/StrS aminotransferase family protein n=1 Tax=Flavivirga eckloniae TaxID=1803846 RepID=A0A2K9PJM7_9FLAO|nr:hypothetical protein [Flavivirga eckloniae]AUP77246.1 hypothetical protein C1H87_00345 [Flavivirga eckloniae]